MKNKPYVSKRNRFLDLFAGDLQGALKTSTFSSEMKRWTQKATL